MEYSNSQIRELIAEWIHSECDRSILSDRLIIGLTFEKLSEIYDMSDRQIRRIVYKLQEQLFNHLPRAE